MEESQERKKPVTDFVIVFLGKKASERDYR